MSTFKWENSKDQGSSRTSIKSEFDIETTIDYKRHCCSTTDFSCWASDVRNRNRDRLPWEFRLRAFDIQNQEVRVFTIVDTEKFDKKVVEVAGWPNESVSIWYLEEYESTSSTWKIKSIECNKLDHEEHETGTVYTLWTATTNEVDFAARSNEYVQGIESYRARGIFLLWTRMIREYTENFD